MWEVPVLFFFKRDYLLSWCYLMTLTWGNIHLWQTFGRRSCDYLETVPSVPSADKDAQWISMISRLVGALMCLWRFRSTMEGRSESQLGATPPDAKWKYLAVICLVHSLIHQLVRTGVRNGREYTETLGFTLKVFLKWREKAKQLITIYEQMIWIKY